MVVHCLQLRLITQDIVLESTSFNIEAFIPLLKERIYVQNPFVRQFVVSWIQALVCAIYWKQLIIPDCSSLMGFAYRTTCRTSSFSITCKNSWTDSS